MLQRQLDVDVLITGHTHKCKVPPQAPPSGRRYIEHRTVGEQQSLTSSASAQCTPGRARRPPARPHVAHEWKGRSLGVLKEYPRGAQAVLEDTQRGL